MTSIQPHQPIDWEQIEQNAERDCPSPFFKTTFADVGGKLVTQRNAVRFAETQYILRVQEGLFVELTPSLSKLVSAGHRSTRSFDSTSGFEHEADAVRAAWTPTAIARVRDVYEAAVFEDYQRLMDSSDAIASSLKVLDAEEQSLRALMTATGGRRTRSLDDSSESTGLVDAEVDSLDKLSLYRFEVFTRFDSYIPEAAQSLLLSMRPKIR